jgi:hypothetical protein
LDKVILKSRVALVERIPCCCLAKGNSKTS